MVKSTVTYIYICPISCEIVKSHLRETNTNTNDTHQFFEQLIQVPTPNHVGDNLHAKCNGHVWQHQRKRY